MEKEKQMTKVKVLAVRIDCPPGYPRRPGNVLSGVERIFGLPATMWRVRTMFFGYWDMLIDISAMSDIEARALKVSIWDEVKKQYPRVIRYGDITVEYVERTQFEEMIVLEVML